MEHIFNWRLVMHPVNWLIVLLVLYLSALLAHIVYVAAEHGEAPFNLPNPLAR